MSERKKLLLRLDPAVHDALARWAGDELRSTNAQIEFLLRRALADAGRLPGNVGRIRRPGRPPSTQPGITPSDQTETPSTQPGTTPSDHHTDPPGSGHTETKLSGHTEPGSSDQPERTANAHQEEP